MEDHVKPKGKFHVEHWRDGKKLGTYDFLNGVTNVGRNALLDIMFHAVSQITPWYLGLINGSGTPALAAGDEMNNHTGWTEDQNYDEATRVEWTEGAAASQSITNSVSCDFTINATTTIYGIFVTSSNTKGGTSGTLWATGAFNGGTLSVVDNDIIKVTYTVTD